MFRIFRVFSITVVGVVASGLGLILITHQPIFGLDFFLIVILSGSMAPTMPPGSIALVEAVKDPAEVRISDVITFQLASDQPKDSTPITHRVVEIENSEGEGAIAWRTKGDASDGPDRFVVQASELRGRVILSVPYVGWSTEFFNSISRSGRMGLIFFPTILLIVARSHSYIRESRPRNKALNRRRRG